MSMRNQHRVFATLAIVACLGAWLVCAGTNALPITKAKLHIDFLDVGHGDSTLITSPTGKARKLG